MKVLNDHYNEPDPEPFTGRAAGFVMLVIGATLITLFVSAIAFMYVTGYTPAEIWQIVWMR